MQKFTSYNCNCLGFSMNTRSFQLELENIIIIYEGRQKVLQLARLVCKSMFHPEVGLWGVGMGRSSEPYVVHDSDRVLRYTFANSLYTDKS